MSSSKFVIVPAEWMIDRKKAISVLPLMAVLSIIPFLAYLAPRALAYVPGVMMLCGFWALVNFRTNSSYIRASFNPKLLIPACAVIILCALSSLWSMNTEFAIERTVKIALILIPGAVLLTQLSHIKALILKPASKGFVGAIVITGVALNMDLWFQAGPFMAINGPNVDPDNLSNMNRSVVTFLFFSIIAAFLLHKTMEVPARVKTAITVVMVFLLAAAIIRTHSQSAQMGLLVASLVWLVFPAHSKKTWIALGALLIGGLFATPWLAQFLYTNIAADMHESGILSHGFAAPRLEIWDMIATKALQSPWIGYGIEATRHIEKFETPMLYTPLDYVLHPHNFAVQIWIEFGLLGVVPAAFLIALILRALYNQEASIRRLSIAVFLSLFANALTSYGLWQSWWLGLFIVIAAMMVTARTLRNTQSQC